MDQQPAVLDEDASGFTCSDERTNIVDSADSVAMITITMMIIAKISLIMVVYNNSAKRIPSFMACLLLKPKSPSL